MQIDIGIPETDRKNIAAGLERLLADTYALYLKSHFYHWNVTGPQFQTLHDVFEQHYTELAGAIDEIAERIRSLGHFAPGSFKSFLELTKVKQDEGDQPPTAGEMIQNALEAHEQVVRTAREVFPLAEAGNDESTADLLTQRMQIGEKTAWMLRSLLG